MIKLKQKKSKSSAALIAVMVLTLGVLGGCAKPEAPEVSTPAPEVSTPAPEVSGPAPEVTLPAPSAKIADRAEDAEGVYNGQIDNNSIEIQMTPTDAVAFRIEAVKAAIEDLKEGDRVKFSYEPNDEGQLVITSIEKMD